MSGRVGENVNPAWASKEVLPERWFELKRGDSRKGNGAKEIPGRGKSRAVQSEII